MQAFQHGSVPTSRSLVWADPSVEDLCGLEIALVSARAPYHIWRTLIYTLIGGLMRMLLALWKV